MECYIGALAKLPSIQHLLATLFTKTNEFSLAPVFWASSLVVVAYRDGDKIDPAIFQMIVLT